MPRKLTEEEFKQRAREKHGNKYDYSKVKYGGSRTKVKIICLEHGPFWQIPSDHLRGSECPQCSSVRASQKTKKDKETFINEAREVHGDWYSYEYVEYVEYVNSETKVKINCPEHGPFWQTPSKHLNGQGCSYCSGKKQLTTEEFKEKARQVHGDKYNYDQVDYKHNKAKVIIICPTHGEFKQKPNTHLNGCGCPYCASHKGGISRTTESFIEDANKKHGDKYDYSQVNYKNNKTKVKIVCPEHGPFWQTPTRHLSGDGCPNCKGFWSPEFIKKYHYNKINDDCAFYIIKMYNQEEQFIKVGITRKSVKERYDRKINLANYQYQIIDEYHGTLLECSEIEQKLLYRFETYQYEPYYWFPGSKECLPIDVLDAVLYFLRQGSCFKTVLTYHK